MDRLSARIHIRCRESDLLARICSMISCLAWIPRRDRRIASLSRLTSSGNRFRGPVYRGGARREAFECPSWSGHAPLGNPSRRQSTRRPPFVPNASNHRHQPGPADRNTFQRRYSFDISCTLSSADLWKRRTSDSERIGVGCSSENVCEWRSEKIRAAEGPLRRRRHIVGPEDALASPIVLLGFFGIICDFLLE